MIAPSAFAQTQSMPQKEVKADKAKADKAIDFNADALNFDQNTDIVTATGNVRVSRDGNKLRADKVIWDRKSGQVRAEGNVIIVTKEGDTSYGDAVTVGEDLRNGVIENLLVALKSGARLAAGKGQYVKGGVSTLERASYTPCTVVKDDGCPKDPVWSVSAKNVVVDEPANRVRYKNAKLDVFGTTIMALPSFSHALDERGSSGFLIPDVRYTQANGLELSQPYYFLLDKNRDLTLTPHVYTNVLPAIEMEYRALAKKGAYKVGGILTYGSRIATSELNAPEEKAVRGYIEASGRFQLTPRWSLTGSGRFSSDRTFLRRYDVTRDDRLRSMIDLERVTRTSYFSVAGWGFQTLRPNDRQGQIPIALPAVDYRKRMDDALLGGNLEFQINSLTLLRTSGQDTSRAFASARWDLRRVLPFGLETQLTAYTRADAYHTNDIFSTATEAYRGADGFGSRFISAGAAEVRLPMIGPFMGGTQRLTPRVQVVASPGTKNLSIPNEDARAVDLEDSNLFSLNRFAGYDRWEDGTRITYGADWHWSKPKWRAEATIGQSYRLSSKPTLFPDGTGLTARTSDIVGRFTVKYQNIVSITNRFRLDKDNLAIRRNELDATIGGTRNYMVIGYLRLNRNISQNLEDLRDREEIRLGGRVQISKNISAFGSTIIDMTDRREDLTSVADGFDPIRHRIGMEYEDDCLRIGLTWRRDYDATGDAKRGNTFQIRLSFKNLGR
jgi:LPS-assembly protein